jgi:hypothetical protein
MRLYRTDGHKDVIEIAIGERAAGRIAEIHGDRSNARIAALRSAASAATNQKSRDRHKTRKAGKPRKKSPRVKPVLPEMPHDQPSEDENETDEAPGRGERRGEL